MYPMYSLRHAASLDRDRFVRSAPSITSVPPVGRSIPAIRLSSVVFPLPLGPISARKVPASTSKSSESKGRITFSPLRYSRVRFLHSISAIAAPLRAAAGDGARFLDHADLRARGELGWLGDDQVAGVQAAGDGDPPVLSRLAELDLAVHGHVLARVGQAHHRAAGLVALDQVLGREHELRGATALRTRADRREEPHARQ